MANAEASVKTAVCKRPVTVRPLLANQSETTQISWRMAKKLGIKVSDTQDVIIEDMFFGPPYYRWKQSLIPIAVTFRGLTCEVYPVINCAVKGAYWEFIVGTDAPYLLTSMLVHGYDDDCTPTPGQGYNCNVVYMGHNVRLVGDENGEERRRRTDLQLHGGPLRQTSSAMPWDRYIYMVYAAMAVPFLRWFM